jgi:hypothetical protein
LELPSRAGLAALSRARSASLKRERLGQPAQRIRVRRPPRVALEVADGPATNAGRLGQRLLAEAGCPAEVPEQFAE